MRPKLLVAIILLTSFAAAQSIQQRRIVRPIDNSSTVRLQGTLVPRARAELDRGPVAATMPMQHMSLVFARTAQQQTALDQLLTEQQDRTSSNYHKWLTPEEFGDRFGLAQPDVDVIAAWLISQGFTIDDIARSRTWIAFSGIAAQVEAAFHTPIDNYLVDGTLHYAPSVEPAVPDALSGVVSAISGLHDFRPHLHSRARRVNPQLTSSISGNHFIVPGDFGTIYDLPDYASGVFQPGNDGTGQTIGIVGQTSTNGTIAVSTVSSDTATFRTVSGLPAANLTLVPVASPTQFASSDADEANLDVQWAGSVAPNAAIVFVYSPDALDTSLQYLVNQNLASVISLSYGLCEAQSSDIATVERYLVQANAQGQTVTAAAGDNGAADCDGTAQTPVATATHGLAVDYPASSVYVTAMGGTELTGDSTATPVNGVAPAQTYWNSSSNANDTSASAFWYIPETTWNDTATTGTNVATGGGFSNQFTKPSWQNNDGVPPSVDNGMRDVPDLVLAASPNHDGYIICSQGSCQTGYRLNSNQTFTVIGGTSAAAPSFAGVVALANQRLGSRQGNINPQIYSLAASSQWAFNDITTGNNMVVCTVGTTNCASSPIGYSAGPGYDLATGWGSIDASGFLNALAGQPAQPDFAILPAVRTITFNSTTPSPISVNVSIRQAFSGTVNLTCTTSTSLPGATCAFAVPNLAAPSTDTVNITPSSSALGAQSGTITLQGVSGSLTHSVTVNVAINYPDFEIAAGNASETVAPGGSTTDTVTLTALQLFSGAVSYSCTGSSGITCSLNPNSITANPNTPVTSTLTVSASSTAVTGSIAITATSGALTHTLQVPVTVANPSFTLTIASPVVSIPSGVTITDNLTVAPVAGFSSDVALTCSVSSSLGTTTCSISPATVTGGSGTAVVTLTGAVLTWDRGAPLPFQHRGLGILASLVFALGIVFTAKPNRGCPIQASFARVGIVRKGLFALLLLCIMFGALSCGGGSNGGGNGSGPTPLNGNVTITGVGGGITQTTTINVTVQ